MVVLTDDLFLFLRFASLFLRFLRARRYCRGLICAAGHCALDCGNGSGLPFLRHHLPPPTHSLYFKTVQQKTLFFFLDRSECPLFTFVFAHVLVTVRTLSLCPAPDQSPDQHNLLDSFCPSNDLPPVPGRRSLLVRIQPAHSLTNFHYLAFAILQLCFGCLLIFLVFYFVESQHTQLMLFIFRHLFHFKSFKVFFFFSISIYSLFIRLAPHSNKVRAHK